MHFNKTICEPIKSLYQIFGVKNCQNISLIHYHYALISESTNYQRENYSELMEKTLISHLVLKFMILSTI